MPTKKIQANKSSEFQIKETEAHLYHLELVKKENDPIKKEYVERKSIQKFTKREYLQMKDVKFFSHYDRVTILHDPTYKGEEPIMDGEELKALIERHTELFGKAPANNANPKNIKAKIEFAELSAQYKDKYQADVPAEIKTVEQLKESLLK